LHNTSKNNFGLDLVRTIAILLVLASHFYSLWKPQTPRIQILEAITGRIGVELFFSLSGFLIGNILLNMAQVEYTSKSLVNFYLRRWFRTFPAYYVVLILLCIYYWRFDYPSFVFAQNFFPFNTWIPYTSPTWTIVLEEWFYFFIPLLTLMACSFMRKIEPKKVILMVCFFISITCLTCRWLYYHTYSTGMLWGADIDMSPLFRLDCCIYGLFAAYIAKFITPSLGKTKSISLILIGISGIGVEGWIWTESFTIDHILSSVNFAHWVFIWLAAFPNVLEIFSAFIVLGIYFLLPSFNNPMKWIITKIASISFGLYLVHMPVLMVLDSYSIKNKVTEILLVTLSAILLRNFIEIPFLSIREKYIKS